MDTQTRAHLALELSGGNRMTATSRLRRAGDAPAADLLASGARIEDSRLLVDASDCYRLLVDISQSEALLRALIESARASGQVQRAEDLEARLAVEQRVLLADWLTTHMDSHPSSNSLRAAARKSSRSREDRHRPEK